MGSKATYLGMRIEKAIDSDPEGIILVSDKYVGKINYIEIAHERTQQRNEGMTWEDQAILRSELGKSMWIARISSPGAIYDASATAQTFSAGKMIDIPGDKEDFPENENGEIDVFESKQE